MNTSILFRKSFDRDLDDEFKMCQQFFNTVEYRSDLPAKSKIIGRYSTLPYYQELEYDVKKIGSELINSFSQYNYIANFEYYQDIKDYTFPTWFDSQDLPGGEYVVKGRTNSRKFNWDSLMYAPDRRTAINIGCDLMYDPLICSQGLIYRKYIPLETYEIGINGMPMTNEWRCFFLGEESLSFGYYWSTLDDTSKIDDVEFCRSGGLKFAEKIAKIVSKKVNFFVLDIAKTQSGDWILVEVNDGQMSGLSLNDPHVLYRNLKEEIDGSVYSNTKKRF